MSGIPSVHPRETFPDHFYGSFAEVAAEYLPGGDDEQVLNAV